jgi:hypothetical protein
MPEDLWRSAEALARKHGICPVARALHIDYGALKKRVTGEIRAEETAGQISTRFLELPPSPVLVGAEPSGIVVEVCDADGAKLVVRFPGGQGLDVWKLTEAFWRRPR